MFKAQKNSCVESRVIELDQTLGSEPNGHSPSLHAGPGSYFTTMGLFLFYFSSFTQ